MEIKVPEVIEVIEFNTKTRQRRVHKFTDFNKAIDFIKKRRDSISNGSTYTICDLRGLNVDII